MPKDVGWEGHKETLVELLTHVRYPMLKSPDDWTDSQRKRMKILFELYPRRKEAYDLTENLRSLFKSKITKDVARVKLHEWYDKVDSSLIRELISARDTIEGKEEYVLNYFNHRSTNAAAESLNSKIKGFRNQVRGVRDLPFFMYRLHVLFG